MQSWKNANLFINNRVRREKRCNHLKIFKVLDLSRVYAAPAGSMMLADLGAEVIRVEHPDGSDSMRDWGPIFE